MEQNYKIKRLPLISWLILPIVIAWIAINYLVGIIHQPDWNNAQAYQSQDVQKTTFSSLPPVREIPDLSWNGGGIVTFWFDDAFSSQFGEAYPILEKAGFTAALSVPINAVNQVNYMDWSEIRNLQLRGWEIASHSRSHNCDPKVYNNPNYLNSEIIGSKKDLEARGFSADDYVTPCGVSTPTMVDLIKQNYRSLRTSGDGLNPLPVKDPYSLLVEEIRINTTTNEVQKWVDEANKNNEWLILLIHRVDHSDEKFSTTPEELKEVVNIVDKSKMQVALPIQVLSLKP